MMKKVTKKLLTSIILTTSLLAGVLSGCSSPASENAVSTTAVATNGKMPITLWYSAGKTAAGVLEEIIQDFNASQDTWEVTGIQQADYDETYAKLQAGIAGGNAPELALLDADKSTNLQSKGLLLSLNEFIENDPLKDADDYIEVFWKQGVADDGSVFAIPAYGTTQVMYYNKAAWETAGLVPDNIKTWQDLAEASRTIKATNSLPDSTFYGWEPMWGADNLIDMALSNGGSLLSEDGKTVMINSDAWVESWDSVRGWIHDEEIMRIHHGGQGWQYWYETMDDVLNDKAGGYIGSSGDQADLDFTKVGAMEQPGFGSNPSSPVARALQLVIVNGKDTNKDTLSAQGAYEFMKFFSSPSNQGKWSSATGYIAVRKSTIDDPMYKEYTEQNPQALIPMNQALHASVKPMDPTGGKIYDALDIAADKIEIENISAKEALDEAAKIAQEALNEYQ